MLRIALGIVALPHLIFLVSALIVARFDADRTGLATILVMIMADVFCVLAAVKGPFAPWVLANGGALNLLIAIGTFTIPLLQGGEPAEELMLALSPGLLVAVLGPLVVDAALLFTMAVQGPHPLERLG